MVVWFRCKRRFRFPYPRAWIWENMLDFRVLDLIAELIVACEPPPNGGPGHPRSATVRVLATLRRFLREGVPWRSLRATVEQGSGSTLRRVPGFFGGGGGAGPGGAGGGGP